MGFIANSADVLLEMGLSSSSTDEENSIIAEAIRRAEGAVKQHLRYDPVQRTRTEYYPREDKSLGSTENIWIREGNQAVLRRITQAATSELQLQHIPIRSVTTLHEDFDGRSGTSSGAFGADTLKTEGTDFWPNYDGLDSSGSRFCRDGILRNIGAWPESPGTVQVVYVAGYTDDELRGNDTVLDASPIWAVVVQEAIRMARRALSLKKKTSIGHVPGIVTSERLGDYSYSIDASTANSLFGLKSELTDESVGMLEEFVNWGIMI